MATSNGKAYYSIVSLLKKASLPYADIVPLNSSASKSKFDFVEELSLDSSSIGLKIIITTRKERLQFSHDKVVCVEDLGDDIGLAKQTLFTLLYPPTESDTFVVGIDPGERTGVAAFVNHRKIETNVMGSVDDTVLWVTKHLEKATQRRRIVKIGAGSPALAEKIAHKLGFEQRNNVRIEFVDERGTSSLNLGRMKRAGTRDQRAAEIIAFREGRDSIRSGVPR